MLLQCVIKVGASKIEEKRKKTLTWISGPNLFAFFFLDRQASLTVLLVNLNSGSKTCKVHAAEEAK